MNRMELFKQALADLKNIPQWFMAWAKTDAKYWGGAFGSMAIFLVGLDLAIGAPVARKMLAKVEFFETEMEQAIEETPIEHFEIGETPLEPTVLNTESLTEPPASMEQTAQYNDDSAVFEEAGGGIAATQAANLGGLGGFDVAALGPGPAVKGPGGVGVGVGTGDKAGSGGSGPCIDGSHQHAEPDATDNR